MSTNAEMAIAPRRRRLTQDATGHTIRQTVQEPRTIAAERSALVLCDLWDRHWCRGANERLAVLLPEMNRLASRLRAAGTLIVHAPSDTITFYDGTPARQRGLDVPRIEPPAPRPIDDPPFPIYHHDGGSDTPPDQQANVWSRQHPAIEIDQAVDVISDNGADLYSLYRHRGIETIVIMGVHLNMCMLDRSFAIKALVRWGLDVIVVRDLTDTMYNPAMPPYVSHDEGTNLVLHYIEGFWCPSVTSDELLAALPDSSREYVEVQEYPTSYPAHSTRPRPETS
jgi:nicotinamidase-related amidase